MSMEQRPPAAPGEWTVRGPVRWGLSRNFIDGLRNTFLYQLFPDRLDPRDWMQANDPLTEPPPPESGEVWFDFFSDTGDSVRATYSLAWALHGPVHLADARADAEPFAGATILPQPHLLVFGGDTAYSVANLRTIDERLVTPFEHALQARRAVTPALVSAHDMRPREVLAIPQNHDWYDSLDGFNRLFRVPPSNESAQRTLGEYHPCQTASYFSRSLLPSWQIWGLDTLFDGVDFRQGAYFRAIGEASATPTHRIIVTPEPARRNGHQVERAHDAERIWDRLRIVDDGAMRVLLAGDVHHYERYDTDASNTTAIVCGAGGASIDPTHVSQAAPADRPRVAYPFAATSRRRHRRLLSPWHVIVSTRLGVIAAILGALFSGFFLQHKHAFEFPTRRVVTLSVLAGVLLGSWGLMHLTRKLLTSTEAKARKYPKLLRILPSLPLVAGLSIFFAADFTRDLALDLGLYLVSGLVLIGLVALSLFAGGRAIVVRGLLGLVAAMLMLGSTGLVVSLLTATSGLWLNIAIGASVSFVIWPITWGLLLWTTEQLGGHATFAGAFVLDDADSVFLRMRVWEDAVSTGLEVWAIGVASVDRRALTAAKAWSDYPRPALSVVDHVVLRTEKRPAS